MERTQKFAIMDGNEAAATIAYQTNEVIAIYPITPASPMGEWADSWSSLGLKNLWGETPRVFEFQSEGGAAGAVHGALQTGALTTTFTASQGLLLMYPNMFKIAGELTSTVFHIAARAVATHALSIFGDHSDVMAVRSSGWAMLFANSVQEVMDFALITQACTLRSRVPFLHVFDGFRTSHELQKVALISPEDIHAMLGEEGTAGHRARALAPERGIIRGTAQNPDVFFQSREACNPFYAKTPEIVSEAFDQFAALTGRRYGLFEYVGAPDAERVLVMMGSGCEAAMETVDAMNQAGERVGLVKVRLYRPFSVKHMMQVLPPTTRTIAVLDRTKEPGASGEPLYQDVITGLMESQDEAPWERMPRVVGGRYGLGSKELTPAMLKGLFAHLTESKPKRSFVLGIEDDVTHLSIPADENFSSESPRTTCAIFWGLGSDGTVGANKNTIKIIGDNTDLHVQGYFVYDSKKSGARTISHLRFGPDPIHSTYLIQKAQFVGIHQFGFAELYPVLEHAAEGATVLLNTPYSAEEVWNYLPHEFQEAVLARHLKLHVIDGYTIAKEAGLQGRINTVMQTAFFALTDLLPVEQAIQKIKESIEKTYGKRGSVVVQRNMQAVENAIAGLKPVVLPEGQKASSKKKFRHPVPLCAPEFVQEVTGAMIAGEGDRLPVSAMPVDGTYPSGTTHWEKRNLALEVPVWESDLCIQCGKCVQICPHSVIRAKRCTPDHFEHAPAGFQHAEARWKHAKDERYTLQVSVEDCTGCRLCVEICPARDKSQINRKAINMQDQRPLRETSRAHWSYFLSLPEHTRHEPNMSLSHTKDVQLLTPLFEFSGACAGCGETPYLKLLSQLVGDRAYIANATGCSSIYGGNLPTTPWTVDRHGRGPAWSNSLFEDNAEFGLGMRLSIDKQRNYAESLLRTLQSELGFERTEDLLAADQTDDAGIEAQRARVEDLKQTIKGLMEKHGASDTNKGPTHPQAQLKDLLQLADILVRKSVWIVGGDGWAYDIGYGGLDHVLASGENVKVLVLDTEVYSNTGGQASKSTPRGAVAKFAAAGKDAPKKDLAMMAINYGNVYVARVAMGSNEGQTLKAFLEAEAYDGPALILAYSPCIAHGVDMSRSIDQQKRAVDSGYWPLYRFDPRRVEAQQNPMQVDSKPPKLPLHEYLYVELRYRMLQQSNPEAAKRLLLAAQRDIDVQWQRIQHWGS